MPAEGRIYSVVFENVAVTAAQDLFELSPADDKPIRIMSWELTNVSDFGDAQEEVLRLEWIRGFTTSGSGGTAPTPRPLGRSDAAAGFAAEVNNTTQATTGTTHILWAGGWNVRMPRPEKYIPEERLEASQADTTVLLRLMAAPADSVTMSGSVVIEELG
jgi:hypothetical protein